MGSLGRNSYLSVLILCLVVSQESTTLVTASATPSWSLFPKHKVDIFNNLPNGATFTIHCKSKDDDLGTHVIGPGDKSEIRFRANLMETTLFFCGVSWQGGQVVFDIFDAKRDDVWGRCLHYCLWKATGDGILGYREDEYSNPDIVIPWKK